MNITTSKDAFSDENLAKLGRKAEKRGGRGRSKPSLPIPPNTILPGQVAPAAHRIQRPAHMPEKSDQPTNEAGERATFYQAAKPKAAPLSPPPIATVAPGSETRKPLPPRPVVAPRPVAAPLRPGLPPRPGMPTGAPLPGSPLPQVQPAYRGMADPNKKVRIIPLGGLEEIGKNMTAFEYGNDIVVVDMGFLFPDNDMLGIDYIIPDVTYLREKKANIRGAIITHGHLDHIGAIPYLVEPLGFPTMYGTPITLGMVKGRLEEFNLTGRCKTVNVEPDKDVLQLGAFRIRPFRLIHSVPGAIGLEIETPNGRIVYATDWKFDYSPASGEPVDLRNLAAIGIRGVDLLFSDSTNADRPGHSISEKVIERSILDNIEEAKGRVIFACFASDLNRVQMAVNAAKATNRKVIAAGRSIQNNLGMAVELKAFDLPAHTLITDKEVSRFNDEQILVIATGAQGEERAALSRMAKGEHRTIKIKKGDTVIISASPIPGNERSVQNVIDLLYKAGAEVIYNKTHDVHTSGHAYQEDLKLMAALMKPKFFFPLHGERARRLLHGKLVESVGVIKKNIIIADNGSVAEMDINGNVSISSEVVPSAYIIVDGLGVGDIGEVVLRDRQSMAQDGIFVIITVFDTKKKVFVSSPDIISRGFIYMRENERFVNEIRVEIKNFLQKSVEGKEKFDLSDIKAELRDHISRLLYQKTEREPIVIPVVIEL